MSRAPKPDPALLAIYLRDAQPVWGDHDGDTDRAEAERLTAVKLLLRFSRAGRRKGQGRDAAAPEVRAVAEFFAAEASRISRLADPAAGFDLFVNGAPVRQGRPPGAVPESFGTVDMVNGRLESDPDISIEVACAQVAAELKQTDAAVSKLYYRWRGERDAYRAKLKSDRERAERDRERTERAKRLAEVKI
jgi:hypothetical protein